MLGSTGNTTGDESTQTHKEQILLPQIPSNKFFLHGVIEFVYNIHMKRTLNFSIFLWKFPFIIYIKKAHRGRLN